MDFHQNFWKCYSHKPKHPYQFSVKSMKNFYFYLYLNFFFLEFQIFYYRIPIFKTQTGKNMQMSSQKIKSVSSRPKNEKKIIAISFFVAEICLLKNRSGLKPKFGRRSSSSIFSKTIHCMEFKWYWLQSLHFYL